MLQAAFPHRPLGDPSVELYRSHLVGYDLRDATLAVQWLIRHSKWLPTVAELCDAVDERAAMRRAIEAPVARQLGPGAWTREDTLQAWRLGARLIAAWRARHGHARRPGTPVVGRDLLDAEPDPKEIELEIQRKRARAEELLRDQEADG